MVTVDRTDLDDPSGALHGGLMRKVDQGMRGVLGL